MSYDDNKAASVVVACLLCLFLYPWFVQLIWNNYLVELCHFGILSYWQSFWICLVSRLVIKGAGSSNN